MQTKRNLNHRVQLSGSLTLNDATISKSKLHHSAEKLFAMQGIDGYIADLMYLQGAFIESGDAYDETSAIFKSNINNTISNLLQFLAVANMEVQNDRIN